MSFAEAKRVRHQTILDVLAKRPMSGKGLAAHLDLNYHTVRKDLIDLKDIGLVHATGRIATEGGVEYAAGSSSPIPLIRNRYGNNEVHVVDMIQAYLAQRPNTPTLQAIMHLPTILGELLAVAHNIAMGEDVNEKRLAEYRKVLSNDLALLHSYAAMVEQVVTSERFWTRDNLAEWVSDERFPSFDQLSEWTQALNE